MQVGSFNYDNTKMVFVDEFEYEDEAQVRSVLDYAVEIKKLPESQQNYVGKWDWSKVNLKGEINH